MITSVSALIEARTKLNVQKLYGSDLWNLTFSLDFTHMGIAMPVSVLAQLGELIRESLELEERKLKHALEAEQRERANTAAVAP